MNGHSDTSEGIDRKTSRSICDAVGERLQQHIRPLESELPTHLEHLMDELRKQDASGRQMRIELGNLQYGQLRSRHFVQLTGCVFGRLR